MGTYKNGIAGPFSGKIGGVVGSGWKGIDYIRSIPRKSKGPPSDRQKVIFRVIRLRYGLHLSQQITKA